MDLGSVFSVMSEKLTGREAGPESFLAVKLSTSSVVATPWSVEGGKIIVGKIGAADISGSDWDSLLAASDRAISTALGEESESIHKTVFAVPNNWTENGKLSAEHLKDLRTLCKELDLSPQGFVVISEALENFYKETEGAPLSAILIGIDKKFCTLSIYRAGKNLGTSELPTDSSKPDDVAPEIEKALTNSTAVEVLPSRIIIYDGKSDLEQIADNFTAFPWTKKLPFLHFPKVEIAPKEVVVKAVAIASGAQMGGQFDLGKTEEGVPDKKTSLSGKIAEEELSEPHSKNETTTAELEEVAPEEAGFTFEEPGHEEIAVSIAAPSVQKETGIKNESEKVLVGQLREITNIPTTSESSEEKRKSPKFAPVLGKASAILKRAISLVTTAIYKLIPQKGGVQSPGHGRKKLAPAIILGVLAFLVALGSIFYFVPKTTALIKVSSGTFDKTMDVVVVTDSVSSVATTSSVLVGSFVDASEIGTKKGVASGKKLVGDKAKGSVTIYSVSSTKTLPIATILSAPDGSKFTLDHEVNVASGDAITPATIATTVTASEIGNSYNLSAGTKFTIGNLSSSQYLAKNESAFTGGSSHQATVVTKDDQDRLFATLSAELSDKARSDLQAKLSPGQNLLANAVTTSVSQKRFTKDIDSEADAVSLDLTMDFRGVVFSQNDLVSLFAQKYSSDIPSGFELSAQNAQVNVTKARTEKNGSSILTASVLGKLLPILDKNDLSQKISGKSQNAGAEVIKSISGVSSVSFETKPRALGFFTKLFLPWKKGSISVEIISE